MYSGSRRFLLRCFIFVVCFSSLFTLLGQIGVVESGLQLRKELSDVAFDDSVLFVFDIDETVLLAHNPKARSAWFGAMLAEQIRLHASPVDAINETRRLYRLAQNETTVEPVDADLNTFISEVHAQGVRCLGLTSRSRELCDITPTQLSSVGLQLDMVIHEAFELHLPPHVFPLAFEKNVFFTAGAHKGMSLGLLLRRMQWKPRLVVFIDDSYHHLEAMESYCSMDGIEVRAFHFTGYQKTMAAMEDRVVKR